MFKVLGHEEFVIGTRYGSGELKVDKDWPWYRQVIVHQRPVDYILYKCLLIIMNI